MSGIVVSCGTMRKENEIFMGSGSSIVSDNSMIGSSCSLSIKIITWKECDTLGKKIGFLFGQIINFMTRLISNTYKLISKVITILYIDKVFEIFYKAIKGISNKLYKLTIWIFQKCIKPIFINRLTNKIVEITKNISFKVNDFLSKSINKVFEIFYKTIKGISNKLYKLTIWIFQKCIKPIFINRLTNKIAESTKNISFKVNDYLIKPIYEKTKELCSKIPIFSCLKETSYITKVANISKKFIDFTDFIATTIDNWILEPLYNRILSPISNSIKDVFLGIIGGASQKLEPEKEPSQT